MSDPNQKSAATVAADVVVEAARAAREVSSTAGTVAAEVVVKAAEAARDLSETTDQRTTQALADALREVFGENTRTQRFVDVSRIPLICQNIVGIHESLKEMKEMMKDSNDTFNETFVSKESFWPVRTIVYAGAGIILTAVLGAIVALVIKAGV